ncbi:MAG: NAD(P)-binding domain-containing protein, partial [Fuerstiella sp.]
MSQSVVPDSIAADVLQKIENQTAQIGIIGLGYVGLPLISAFTNAGFRCIGYDVDKSKVDAL